MQYRAALAATALLLVACQRPAPTEPSPEAPAELTPPALPSYSEYDNLPPPPTLSVTINPDPTQPNNAAGTFTYTTTVSGGSGTYTYRWYWRPCNWNDGAEWCANSYFESYETGSAFTYTIGAADTRIDFVVQVQEVSGSDTPATGKGHLWTAGPMFGSGEGSSEGSNPFCGPMMHYPLSRHVEGQGWIDYRRHQCTGTVEYPR
jgi:hypothetical protein